MRSFPTFVLLILLPFLTLDNSAQSQTEMLGLDRNIKNLRVDLENRKITKIEVFVMSPDLNDSYVLDSATLEKEADFKLTIRDISKKLTQDLVTVIDHTLVSASHGPLQMDFEIKFFKEVENKSGDVQTICFACSGDDALINDKQATIKGPMLSWLKGLCQGFVDAKRFPGAADPK